MCDGDVVQCDDLPKQLREAWGEESYAASLPGEGIDFEAQVEAYERSMIKQAMKRTGNSQTKAARLLRLTPRSLRYKLEKYNLKNREN